MERSKRRINSGGVKGTEECIQREGGIMRKNENG